MPNCQIWEILLQEAAKCDLVCFNCHMEIHYPNLQMGHPGLEPGTNGL